MNQDKLNKVFSDQAFTGTLFAMETAGEVKEALLEKGIELTEEEILAIHDILGKVERGEITQEQLEELVACSEEGELSEDALKLVSGGSVTLTVTITVASLIKVLVGTGIGTATVAGAAVGIYDAIKRRW